MSAEVQFVGGPADGRLLVIDGDPMNPPPTTEVLVQEPFNWRELDAAQVPEIRKALYKREVNPSDDGPLWLYRYDRQASAGSVRPDEETDARVTLDNTDARYTPTQPLKPHYPDEETP